MKCGTTTHAKAVNFRYRDAMDRWLPKNSFAVKEAEMFTLLLLAGWQAQAPRQL